MKFFSVRVYEDTLLAIEEHFWDLVKEGKEPPLDGSDASSEWMGKVNESEHTYKLLQLWIDLLDAKAEHRLVPLNESLANIEWNLPPYGSSEFMELLKRWNMTLDEFKIRPIYTYAVDQGLIVNEEWRG